MRGAPAGPHPVSLRPASDPTVPAGGVPAPAHPQHRREPLPGEQPKPSTDDASAAERVAAIRASASYRPADAAVAYLEGDEHRGLRLQLDYAKAETYLERAGIEHTIVVFGSTRIPEPAAAARHVDALRAEVALQPRAAEPHRRLAVAERIHAKSSYYDVAREFGRLVGGAGSGGARGRVALMTGGGPGIMEAANRGAYDVGAASIGLNIALPREQYPNPYISPELCFQFHYFAIRKLHFLQRARALVAFPGGFGTIDELFETLTLVQTRKIRPVPVVMVDEAYWRRAVDIDFLAAEGAIDVEDRELFWYAESADEIWSGILRWHEANGTPLVPAPAAGGAAP